MLSSQPLISPDLLKESKKLLVVTHLALGDFTYMQTYFKYLADQYPHLKIDIWVDEGRGKPIWRRWGKESKYILYDWLDACPFINKVYKGTTSCKSLCRFFKQSKKEQYPIVVSFASLRAHRYAKYARLISPGGFVVGIKLQTKKFNFIQNHRFKKLNKTFDFNVLDRSGAYHITDMYAAWFKKLFGLQVEKKNRVPFIDIPQEWREYGELKFLKWNLIAGKEKKRKVVFINAFAKNKRRCWPIENVFQLISRLQNNHVFHNTSFVINVLPFQIKQFEDKAKNLEKQNIFLFTADCNFFQLPAILCLCDHIISVETCVIHFAPALKVPVIALMRQKNPEWIPYGFEHKVVLTEKRKSWVKDISVEQVVGVIGKQL